MAYSATASSTQTHNRAKYKPHDKSILRVTKGHLDCTGTGNIGADQAVNVVTIPAGSVVLAVGINVTTDDTNDTPFDVGFGEAGEQFVSNANVGNTGTHTVLGVPYLIQTATNITLTPDSAAINNGIIDIYATYIEFDSLTATT